MTFVYREAHVIWDNVSGNSKGYGFVAFRDKTDAEQAIATMNGEYLGSRPIRCNWATQKGKKKSFIMMAQSYSL